MQQTKHVKMDEQSTSNQPLPAEVPESSLQQTSGDEQEPIPTQQADMHQPALLRQQDLAQPRSMLHIDLKRRSVLTFSIF